LQLAGLAAHRIEETSLHNTIVSKVVLAKMIADYPVVLTTLFRAHQGVKQSADVVAAARAQMKLWAAEPDLLASPADVLDQPAAQDLAMEANARMARHDYAGAAALDARLADTPEARAARQNIIAAARQMRTAERVDSVSSQQRALAEKTLASGRSSALAQDQEQVAQRIEQVRRSAEAMPASGNSRDQAMAAIVRAQEELADMPGKLAGAHPRAAIVSGQINAASGIAVDLNRFNPETSPAVQAIEQNLIPALRQFSKAVGDQRPADVAQAAGATRAAIAQAQEALTRTQQKFAEQDPLVAARWFAEAAAAALSRTPPDLSAARQQQSNAAHALENAWTAAIRKAALQRLAGSATISSPLSSPTAPPGWQPLTPSAEPPRDSEPAGYADALRAYFQTLSQGELNH
jgi:hypothetical protein